MNLVPWLALAVLILLSALFSGSETGLYSVSRLRIDARARQGQRRALIIQWLLRDESALLITILIGNNLMVELATRVAGSRVEQWSWVPQGTNELVLALFLTPVLFFFGELLPKDLFRHRPHGLVGATAPLMALFKLLFLPVSLPLAWLSAQLERLVAGAASGHTRLGRQAVVELLEEVTRQGALEPHAERLARNVLELRNTRLADVLVPWTQVRHLSADQGEAAQRESVVASDFSRLPFVDGRGRAERYVHQLDILAGGADRRVEECARRLLALDPELSVDRALARLRTAGQRMALVGDPAAPRGIVTLKDLVEEISGELAGW